jgi:hypothetical protein
MQIVNALNEPKNAMTDENSGMDIEIPTAVAAVNARMRMRSDDVFKWNPNSEVVSIPKKASIVVFSCQRALQAATTVRRVTDWPSSQCKL